MLNLYGVRHVLLPSIDLISRPLREPASLDVRDNDVHLERIVILSTNTFVGFVTNMRCYDDHLKDLSATSGALYATIRQFRSKV